jgi:hypothetical protein
MGIIGKAAFKVMRFSRRTVLSSTRSFAAHLDCRFVLALAQIHNMPEQTVRRPLDVADLGDHFGPDPMDPAKHQR